jgi:hypothetical protein
MRARKRVALTTTGVIGLTAGWLVMTGPGVMASAGAMAYSSGVAKAGTAASGPDRAAASIRRAAGEPAAAVEDSGPALRSKVGIPAPVMSIAMISANAEKQVAARAFIASSGVTGNVETKCTSSTCRKTLPAARDLTATQRPQLTDYYCGPATVTEMLAQMGKSVGQRKTARELGTNSGGTGWSDGRGYPVPQVLNKNQARNSYVAVGLPWSPTKSQLRAYETDLVADINHNGGVPLAGDAYEVPGGPHLVGHPVNQTIFHWFDIRGYRRSGATTDYEDSVHGASSIGWAAAVPAYSSLPSSTIVNIVGARGYDW